VRIDNRRCFRVPTGVIQSYVGDTSIKNYGRKTIYTWKLKNKINLIWKIT